MISGIMSFRNCIEYGYPFVEAILSVLPIMDEYLINDGGSTDGTFEILKQLKELYPNKIRLYQIPDYKSARWECVSESYNKLIKEANGDWIFMGNADEVIHEKDIKKLRNIHEKTTADVLRYCRREVILWTRLSKAEYHPCRSARKSPSLFMNWDSYGGDEFLDESGWIREPPRCESIDVLIWHLYNMFPGNYIAKLQKDAEFVASGDKGRVKIYEKIKGKRIGRRIIKDVMEDLPLIVQRLVGLHKYPVYSIEDLINLSKILKLNRNI